MQHLDRNCIWKSAGFPKGSTGLGVFFFFFFLREIERDILRGSREVARKEREREDLKQVPHSMPSTESDVGLDLTTLRS